MEFLIGNIIGRLLLCYLLVWLFHWVFSKFNYGVAVGKTHSKWGYLSMAVIFILPILAETGSYI